MLTEQIDCVDASARPPDIPDEGVREVFWTVPGRCRERVRRRFREANSGRSTAAGGVDV